MKLEPYLYFAVLVVLTSLVAIEGRAQAELERQVALAPKDLYRRIAKSKVTWQLVDLRSAEAYEEAHVPGAIPVPGCDLAKSSDAVRMHVLASVPTIIISESGESESFSACAQKFTMPRNLAGGFTAWSDEGLPEDSSDWAPPKPGAGGGCL